MYEPLGCQWTSSTVEGVWIKVDASMQFGYVLYKLSSLTFPLTLALSDSPGENDTKLQLQKITE